MNRRDAMKALMSLPATATVTRSAVQPNDVIVIESDDVLSCAGRADIANAVRQVWPNNKVVVLDKGLRMKIAEGRP